VVLAATAGAALLLPFAGWSAPLGFRDLVLFAYLLGQRARDGARWTRARAGMGASHWLSARGASFVSDAAALVSDTSALSLSGCWGSRLGARPAPAGRSVLVV
jgi:hypothetical protein